MSMDALASSLRMPFWMSRWHSAVVGEGLTQLVLIAAGEDISIDLVDEDLEVDLREVLKVREILLASE